MDTPWLDDVQLGAWVRFAAVLELLPGALDSQLRREAGLSHFEYFTLAMLSEAPDQTMRMSSLAALTNSSLARLSHVVRRLEDRGLIERFSSPSDARVTNARLTAVGRQKVQESAPGHVGTVRHHVIDALTPEQVHQLSGIAAAILARLDPAGIVARTHDRTR